MESVNALHYKSELVGVIFSYGDIVKGENRCSVPRAQRAHLLCLVADGAKKQKKTCPLGWAGHLSKGWVSPACEPGRITPRIRYVTSCRRGEAAPRSCRAMRLCPQDFAPKILSALLYGIGGHSITIKQKFFSESLPSLSNFRQGRHK